MMARWLGPALALALPLVAEAQSAGSRRSSSQQRADEDVPLVRVWIPGTWNFRFGQPVQVMFEVSEASHVTVLRVDGRGRLSVLWPQRNNLQTAARAGHEYRITGAYASFAAFNADYEYGQGMVIALASYDPIDLTAFRRYRNDPAYYRNASSQRPYLGGVRRIVDRIAQEVLYAPDSPFDYDVAFYSAAGRGLYSNAGYYSNCDYNYYYLGYPRARYYRSYSEWAMGPLFSESSLSDWNDCYSSSFYRTYLAYCASWALVGSGYPMCRLWNPSWPAPPPVAGGPTPQTPKPNTEMIDTILSRPVAEQPATNGTTHIVRMEPVRDAPNVTRWLPDDENDALSIPRLRRGSNDERDESRVRGRMSTRDEGFTRSPGTTIRTADPRAGDPPPDRGTIYMPPVRQAPREPTWRDDNRPDRGAFHTPRWERPVSSEPRHPSGDGGRIDRGSTSSGTASPSAGGAAMTPRADASVTKTSESKETKPPPERKPQ